MAAIDRQADDLSDGSDIEVENDEMDDNERILNGNEGILQFDEIDPNNDEWLRDFLNDDSDDEDFDGFDGDWVFENFSDRPDRPFRGDGGAPELHPEEAQPQHYFSLLWGEDLWEHIVRETNRYADQERTRNPPPPFAPRWKPVDVPTIKAFMGLCLCMGILRLPARNDYWRVKKSMFGTNFNKIMPRDRFNLIWRYLHLNNNEAPRPEVPDKLLKIRHFLTYLTQKFRTAYQPYGYTTVDESMVKFKGRLSFRQYLPAKPTKWGVKIWVLAESDTGYMMNFQVYTGKADTQGKGLAHRVVTDLMTGLHHRNVKVFMDNFYTSTALMTELLMRGIPACGTVRANRKGLPVPLLPKNLRLNKHQYRVAQKDDLSFCTWMDTKPVLFLSNYHDPTELGTVNRRSGNALQQQVVVPQIVSDYQQHMKGVDKCDQMIGYYMLDHRSKKWWRRLFYYFLMATVHNAYIIAKDNNPEVVRQEWPNFQDFVEDLATGLIGDFRSAREAPIGNAPRPAQRHDFVKLFDKDKVCVECRAKAGPRARAGTSKFGCQQCNVAVHTQCFPGHITRANN